MAEPTAEELAADNARLKDQNRTVAQRAAFDRHDDYRWHDSDLSFAAMQRQGYLAAVQIKATGGVDEVALRKAVRAFAQQNAYLIDEQNLPPERPRSPFPSGGNVGGGRRRYGRPPADETALRKKFPALNN